MSVKCTKLIRSLLGLDDTVTFSADGDEIYRPIGPDKNIVRNKIKAHLRNEISNVALKKALSRYCSDEENADLDKWFPDEKDENAEEDEDEDDDPLDSHVETIQEGTRGMCISEGCSNSRSREECEKKHDSHRGKAGKRKQPSHVSDDESDDGEPMESL